LWAGRPVTMTSQAGTDPPPAAPYPELPAMRPFPRILVFGRAARRLIVRGV
jgi:hypothetical protein